jgi:hypothetical protein
MPLPNGFSRLVLVAVVVGSALLLSGCGGSGNGESVKSGSATTTVSEPSGSEEQKFTNENWAVLASEPDVHKGAEVDFFGQVFLAPERDEDGVYMQVYADPQNSEHNTIVGYGEPDFAVAEDDFVHVTGTAEGKYEGENAFGATLTVPIVRAKTIKVVDALAAAPPAVATLPPRSTTKAKITVTVRRVEFAATETRVLLKVTNRSGQDVNVYDSSMKAVQAGQQYEPEFSSDYEELSSELVPGVATSGVVVFPKLNPNAGLKLIVEVDSGNFDIGNLGTLRYTFAWA